MKIIKPKRLKKSDVIGIIAPASTVDDSQKLEQAVRYFEGLGYRVEIGQNVLKRRGYLAGDDSERLDDIYSMFENKHCKAIIALRGGYGCGRLLNSLDYELIRKNPKIFVGYSDLTILQNAIFTRTGLITFSGPMAASDFSGEIDEYTEEYFWQILTSSKKIGQVKNPPGTEIFSLNNFSSTGRLIGGNFSNFNALIGTEYLPKLRSGILFLEEVNEPPYKIDRMFNHLRCAKILDVLGGVILGHFVNCNTSELQSDTLTLMQVFEDYLSNLEIPVVYNAQFGHISQKLTLPIGGKVRINARAKSIEYLDSAVR